MRKYIELTEYDNNGRTIVFVDSIQGLWRVHDYENDKGFTEVIVSGYTFIVNETIDEILEKMERVKEDNKSLCEYDQGHRDGIGVGYEIAMQKIDEIKAKIEQRSYGVANDSVIVAILKILDNYMT